MRLHTAILTAALGAAVFATPAVAASQGPGIKYADLDLSTEAGQKKLDRRIDSAARSACGMDQVQTGRFTPSTEARQCYQRTKTSVHEQVAELIAREKTRG